MGGSYLESPLFDGLLRMVFAFILVGALTCEALALAKGVMYGVKHIAKIVQDFVRTLAEILTESFSYYTAFSSTDLQLLAIWHLVQTLRTERANYRSTTRAHAGA